MPTSQSPTGYRMDRILIPVDGSPRSQDAAEGALALATDPTNVTLLHVVDSHGLGGEESLRTLDALAGLIRRRAPGAEVATRLTDGDAVDEILEAAERGDPDLIVMATREFLAPGVSPNDLASARVAANTHIPVLVLRRQEGQPAVPVAPPARVVVPLDGSLRSLQALPIAAGIARETGAPVYLVAVVDATESLPPAYAYSCPDCDPDLQDALTFLECQANGMLDSAERSLRRSGLDVTSDLILGRVAPSLLGILQEGDLMVMTTRGEGRHIETHIGRVATRMLREAPVPVIVFHPHLATTITHNPLTTDWESAIPPHRAARR